MGLPVLNTGKENKFRQAENPEDGKTSQQFAVRVSRPTSILHAARDAISQAYEMQSKGWGSSFARLKSVKPTVPLPSFRLSAAPPRTHRLSPIRSIAAASRPAIPKRSRSAPWCRRP
jgi:hypothetical protein